MDSMHCSSANRTRGQRRTKTLQKIVRPPNAFIVFCQAMRQEVAARNPNESNKEITKRLGLLWNILPVEEQAMYFARARVIEADHRRRYPDYIYDPNRARVEKALRRQERSHTRTKAATSSRPQGLLPSRVPDTVHSAGASNATPGGIIIVIIPPAPALPSGSALPVESCCTYRAETSGGPQNVHTLGSGYTLSPANDGEPHCPSVCTADTQIPDSANIQSPASPIRLCAYGDPEIELRGDDFLSEIEYVSKNCGPASP